MKPRVLLFDLDGTLTDSRPGIVRSMRYALECLGAPCPPDATLGAHIGAPLGPTFGALLRTSDPIVVDRALALYRERYADTGLYENRLYPGIVAMLQTVAGSGRLFVATQKYAPYAERIVEHFGLARHFAGVYGTGLDGRLDDKPQVIAHLLARERVSGAEAVMIGDRALDVQAARGNGARALGVLWGYGSREELLDAGAGALCETPSALVPALARLG